MKFNKSLVGFNFLGSVQQGSFQCLSRTTQQCEDTEIN